MGESATMETTSTPAGRLLAGLRVVIVDDDADTLDIEGLVLEDAGATVEGVRSVSAAIQALSLAPASVVISDLDMPGEDGLDLARRLRADKTTARIPLIAFTAHAGAAVRDQALAGGFDRFVIKPVHPYGLVRMVAEAVNRA